VPDTAHSVYSPESDPALVYQQRLTLREAEAQQWQRKHIWTGNARVLLFILLVLLWWKIARSGSPSIYWLVLVIAAFIVLAVVHRRILAAKSRTERAIAMYRRGVARVEDRWSGQGEAGNEFRDPAHVYADDLDIFGDGGLFQLLCVARTRMGKETLAGWLLHASSVEKIRGRQAAVTELKEKLDFREALAVAGDSEAVKADPEKLRRWAETKIDFNQLPWAIVSPILAVVSVAALVYAVVSYFQTGTAAWTSFLIVLVIQALVMRGVHRQMEALFLNLDQACQNLDALSAIVRRIESEVFSSGRLKQLHGLLISAQTAASQAIARLGMLCDFQDSRHNMVVRLIDLPLLYSVQVACALQRWRKKHAGAIAGWLEAIGEMEALLSLATYAFEHPHDPFPELASADDDCFRGKALGHPLLPETSCVRNDVALDRETQVLLVSGSNMSGKSTLLRVVGINAVLAYAGAPVRAESLRLSSASIGAAMRVSDSLQKGVSHFYAEIQRIRQVVELSSHGRLIFLFDEILQGTNSEDRRVGAEGILRTLISNGAIGLVTTHDLALTSIAELFPGRVLNVHFQERLESGKLSFDYQLRPGVVSTHNGVELMRSVGLDV
jgi:hypothetical protein